ncbi:MAG: universal stress protein [Ignavibacteria bacterium]|jgi:nucleotide-binding universal stress UspA family protein
MKSILNIRKIIVPTDLSKLSLTALDYAKDIAERWEAEIYLVYVLEKSPPFLAMRSLDVDEKEVMASMQEKAKEQLNEEVAKYSKDAGAKIIPVLLKGIDYEEIVKYSKEIKSDLIVLATHGRTGVLHTLLGSVAEKVIRYAKCPVLVTTPDESDV